MVDGTTPADPSQEPTGHEELPDRLRVHSLARTLGTSSKRVLDALSALDGRIRSAHSSVDRDDAVRVRDLLAAAQTPAGSENPESGAPVMAAGSEGMGAAAAGEGRFKALPPEEIVYCEDSGRILVRAEDSWL